LRLFIAIRIPADVRAALASFVQELRGVAPQAKWVRPANLHITLKFLGETDSAKLSAIQNSLVSIRSAQPVTFEFHGLGFFPNEKRPRVFWAGMEASPNLKSLAGEIDHSLGEIGFPVEGRPFTPHLTLARFNQSGHLLKLHTIAKESSSRSFGSLTAREFHLIESKLKSSGAEYTTLHSFRFVTEA
jgi:RNA 2',3'-cyclic 3'-phosphodiesterase